MVSIEDVLTWQPAKLTSVADQLTEDRKVLVGLQDELTASRPPATWESGIKPSAEATHTKLGTRLADQVAEVSQVITDLDLAAGIIKTAKAELESALASARAAGFKVDTTTGVIKDTEQPTDVTELHVRQVLMNTHAGNITDALTAAVEADANLTLSLKTANSGDVHSDGRSLSQAQLQLPAHLGTLTPEQLEKHLRSHPELLDDPQLVRELISELGLNDKGGNRDSNRFEMGLLNTQLGDTRTGGSWEDYSAHDAMDALATLGIADQIAARAQDQHETIPDNLAAYLKTFYRQTDASLLDNLDLITGDDSPFTEAQQERMAQDLADGLLLSTDERLNESLGDLPPALTKALNDTPGIENTYHANYVEHEEVGGDGFRQIMGLLEHSDLEGGKDFSTHLTLSSEATGDYLTTVLGYNDEANAETSPGRGEEATFNKYAESLQTALRTASRNDLSVNEILAQAVDNDYSASALTNLYRLPWPDDGHAMSGYTDTIVDGLNSKDIDQHNLALQSSMNMIKFLGGDTTEGPVVDQLMKNTLETGDEGPGHHSIGDVNPEVVRGLSDFTAANLPDLADARDSLTLYRPDDEGKPGDLDVSRSDSRSLFTLANSSEESSRDLSLKIGAFEQHELDVALRHDDPSELSKAGMHKSTLDASQAAGIYNASAMNDGNQSINSEAAYQKQLVTAQLGKTVLTLGTSELPIVGGPVSALSDLALEELMNDLLPPPDEIDSRVNEAMEGTALGSEERMAYDYAQAQLALGHDVPPRIEDMLIDGRLPDYMSEDGLSADDQLTLLTAYDDDPRFQRYVKHYDPVDEYQEARAN